MKWKWIYWKRVGRYKGNVTRPVYFFTLFLFHFVLEVSIQSLGQIWRGTQTFTWSVAGWFSQHEHGSEGIQVEGLAPFLGVRAIKQYFESVEFSSSHTDSLYLEWNQAKSINALYRVWGMGPLKLACAMPCLKCLCTVVHDAVSVSLTRLEWEFFVL